MSWLVISGIALPAFDVSMGTADGAFARGLSGAPMALSGMRGSVGERRSYQTPPLDFSTAMFWWRLFAREGDVWSFEANDDVSSHGVPTIDSIAPATSNPKFGTYHAARSGADIDVAAIDIGAIGEVTIQPIKGTLASTVRASLLQVPRRAE